MGVEVRDRGAMTLLLNAGKIKSMRLRVGIKDGGEQYPDRDKTTAEIAAIQEFGLGTTPSRPFIRGWFDERSASQLSQPFSEAANQILKGKITRVAALKEIGDRFSTEMKERILRHIPPPLAESTVAKKHATGADMPTTPLVDTHLMIDSIKSWEP